MRALPKPLSPLRLTHSDVITRPDSSSPIPPLRPTSPHAPPQPAHLPLHVRYVSSSQSASKDSTGPHFLRLALRSLLSPPALLAPSPADAHIIMPASKRAERCVRIKGGGMQMCPSARGGIIATVGACVASHLRLLLASIASAPPASCVTLYTYTSAQTQTPTQTQTHTPTPTPTQTHQQREARKPP